MNPSETFVGVLGAARGMEVFPLTFIGETIMVLLTFLS